MRQKTKFFYALRQQPERARRQAKYTDDNRQKLSSFKTRQELEAYLKRLNTVELFAQYGEKNGLKRRNLMIQKSHTLLERFINSRLIYNVLDEQAWTEFLNTDDPAILETLRVFKAGESFPKPETASPKTGSK